MYNAILWTAKFDSLATASSLRAPRPLSTSSSFAAHAQVMQASGRLVVTLHADAPHTVELLTPQGQRIAARSGQRKTAHEFAELADGVYLVTVATPAGRATQPVVMR